MTVGNGKEEISTASGRYSRGTCGTRIIERIGRVLYLRLPDARQPSYRPRRRKLRLRMTTKIA